MIPEKSMSDNEKPSVRRAMQKVHPDIFITVPMLLSLILLTNISKFPKKDGKTSL